MHPPALLLARAVSPTLSPALAAQLLDEVGGLRGLISAPPSVLERLPGVGPRSAERLHAMMQLGQLALVQGSPPTRVEGPADALALLRPALQGLEVEVLHGVFLNQKHGVLLSRRLSEGGAAFTVVDPRVVFRVALQCGAASVLVGHNHPSGDPLPSQEDRAVTQRLVEAGRMLGIPLIDHLIITDQGHASLAEMGLV